MYLSGSSSSLSYQGLPIKYYPATGLVCLTDLWRAQCSPASQRPLAWVRLEATQKLLKRLAARTGIEPLWSEGQHREEAGLTIAGIPGILETAKEDDDLRTYATADLAVVYAYYLAPECYKWVLANLGEETALVEEWSGQQSQADFQKRRKAFTRRAVIAAGWSIPVVTALALNQRASAQISPRAATTGTGTTGTTTPGTNTGVAGTTTTGTNTGVAGTTTPGTNTGVAGTTTPGTNTGVAGTTTTGTNTGVTGTTTPGTGTTTTGTTNLGTGTTTGTTNLGTGTTTGTGTLGTGTLGTGTTNLGTGTTTTGTGTLGTGTTSP